MKDDTEKLLTLYRLKEVERWGTVGRRHESSAEHTFSALVLARYFLPRIEPALDELEVMRTLLYHDVVEVEVGDRFVLGPGDQREQTRREADALPSLLARLPAGIDSEVRDSWTELERQQTRESRFCLAIDKLDPVLHSILRQSDWKQRAIRLDEYVEAKELFFREFPPILRFFRALLEQARRRGYFSSQP